jgi:hypothetical protein
MSNSLFNYVQNLNEYEQLKMFGAEEKEQYKQSQQQNLEQMLGTLPLQVPAIKEAISTSKKLYESGNKLYNSANKVVEGVDKGFTKVSTQLEKSMSDAEALYQKGAGIVDTGVKESEALLKRGKGAVKSTVQEFKGVGEKTKSDVEALMKQTKTGAEDVIKKGKGAVKGAVSEAQGLAEETQQLGAKTGSAIQKTLSTGIRTVNADGQNVVRRTWSDYVESKKPFSGVESGEQTLKSVGENLTKMGDKTASRLKSLDFASDYKKTGIQHVDKLETELRGKASGMQQIGENLKQTGSDVLQEGKAQVQGAAKGLESIASKSSQQVVKGASDAAAKAQAFATDAENVGKSIAGKVGAIAEGGSEIAGEVGASIGEAVAGVADPILDIISVGSLIADLFKGGLFKHHPPVIPSVARPNFVSGL